MTLVPSFLVFDAGRRASRLHPNGNADARRTKFRYSVRDAFVRVFTTGDYDNDNGNLRLNVNNSVHRDLHRVVNADCSAILTRRGYACKGFSPFANLVNFRGHLLRVVTVIRHRPLWFLVFASSYHTRQAG